MFLLVFIKFFFIKRLPNAFPISRFLLAPILLYVEPLTQLCIRTCKMCVQEPLPVQNWRLLSRPPENQLHLCYMLSYLCHTTTKNHHNSNVTIALTLPAKTPWFLRYRIIEIALCTIYGAVNGIHIDPTIHHQNEFQPVLLTLFSTCFIVLMLSFQLLIYRTKNVSVTLKSLGLGVDFVFYFSLHALNVLRLSKFDTFLRAYAQR